MYNMYVVKILTVELTGAAFQHYIRTTHRPDKDMQYQNQSICVVYHTVLCAVKRGWCKHDTLLIIHIHIYNNGPPFIDAYLASNLIVWLYVLRY